MNGGSSGNRRHEYALERDLGVRVGLTRFGVDVGVGEHRCARAGEHRVVGEERRRRHLSDTVAVGVGDHGCVPVSQEENTGAVQLQWMVDLETVRLVRSPPVLSVLDVGGEPGGLTGVEEDGREVVQLQQNGARSDGVTLAPNPYSSYCWSELQNAPVSPATRMRLPYQPWSDP